jgi:putative restriction endonuclease
VVRLKYFDEDFDEVSDGEVEPPVDDHEPFQPVEEKESDYTSRRLRDRARQAVFRQRVLAAYGHRCCVTGEGSREVLDAAHI